MIALEIHETEDFVLARECAVLTRLVLGDTDCEVTGDADIEHARFAGQDVDVEHLVAVVHDAEYGVDCVACAVMFVTVGRNSRSFDYAFARPATEASRKNCGRTLRSG